MLFTEVAVCPVSHKCKNRHYWQVKIYNVLLTVQSMQFSLLYFRGSTTLVDQEPPIFEISRSTHIPTTITQQDSFGWVIRLPQRPLPDNTHNCRNRQTFMLPAGFEPATPTSEQLQTHQYVQLRLFKYQWLLYVPHDWH